MTVGSFLGGIYPTFQKEPDARPELTNSYPGTGELSKISVAWGMEQNDALAKLNLGIDNFFTAQDTEQIFYVQVQKSWTLEPGWSQEIDFELMNPSTNAALEAQPLTTFCNDVGAVTRCVLWIPECMCFDRIREYFIRATLNFRKKPADEAFDIAMPMDFIDSETYQNPSYKARRKEGIPRRE
ncbi:hypothetical protein LWF15_09490 [Kineosporia rhizophila]|uniref:hypothetical protein n=1 Tax=Kineosporia rhizophila TaxID=84633 RepID=UPI001E3FEAC5|nr:hypothetical protein [Kineosporia rhizophila]MCE0535746.1 hypothetical protein [Kineosporia rhizophila]